MEGPIQFASQAVVSVLVPVYASSGSSVTVPYATDLAQMAEHGLLRRPRMRPLPSSSDLVNPGFMEQPGCDLRLDVDTTPHG